MKCLLGGYQLISTINAGTKPLTTTTETAVCRSSVKNMALKVNSGVLKSEEMTI